MMMADFLKYIPEELITHPMFLTDVNMFTNPKNNEDMNVFYEEPFGFTFWKNMEDGFLCHSYGKIGEVPYIVEERYDALIHTISVRILSCVPGVQNLSLHASYRFQNVFVENTVHTVVLDEMGRTYCKQIQSLGCFFRPTTDLGPYDELQRVAQENKGSYGDLYDILQLELSLLKELHPNLVLDDKHVTSVEQELKFPPYPYM